MAHNIFPPDEIEERFIMSKHACINAIYVPSLPSSTCQEPCLLCIYSLKTFKLNINRWSSQEWNHPIVALSQNVYRHILKVTELKKASKQKLKRKMAISKIHSGKSEKCWCVAERTSVAVQFLLPTIQSVRQLQHNKTIVKAKPLFSLKAEVFFAGNEAECGNVTRNTRVRRRGFETPLLYGWQKKVL